MSTNLNSLPALPAPRAANAPWPTFSLSPDERRAIISGKLPPLKLGRTGLLPPANPKYTRLGATQVTQPLNPATTQVLTQGLGTLQTATTSTTGLSKPGVSPVRTSSPASPPIAQVAPNTTGMLSTTLKPPSGPVRTSGPVPPPTVPLVPNTTGMLSTTPNPPSGPVRTSGPVSPPASPLPPPTGQFRQMPQKANPLAVTSFIVAFLSIISLIGGFVYATVPAVISLAPWAIFATAVLAMSFGISAMRKRLVVDKSKVLARWSIFLSVSVTLIEIARLLFHF